MSVAPGDVASHHAGLFAVAEVTLARRDRAKPLVWNALVDLTRAMSSGLSNGGVFTLR